MQVFIPFASPLGVARSLDIRRLRKQIIEVGQILKAIETGAGSWRNHPVVKMYRDHTDWLRKYQECLKHWLNGERWAAIIASFEADRRRPAFITRELCDQHKRRLYTKDPEHYRQFAKYGTSPENWYIVDGRIVKYISAEKENPLLKPQSHE